MSVNRRAKPFWRSLEFTLPVLVAALLLLPWLGQLDLWAPDEPRYAQISEEIRALEHGPRGLALLHLNGQPYTQKPPLYFWLAAGFGSFNGHVDHWSARLPSALAGIAIIGLTAAFGRHLYTHARAGLVASLLLLGVLRFSHQARRVQIDVLLTLCEIGTLLAFWSLNRSAAGQSKKSTPLLLCMHGAMGLGLLAKGPVAALPYLIILFFLVWEGRAREVRQFFPLWGLCIALAPAMGWLTASVFLAPSNYFDQAVSQNLMDRFLFGLHHPRPFYYYLYQLPIDFLPWTPVALFAVTTTAWGLWQDKEGSSRSRSTSRFLLTWLGVFFTFFSISAEKRGLYMLPAFPALALLCEGWLARQLLRDTLPKTLFGGSLILLMSLGLASLIGVFGLPPNLLDQILGPDLMPFWIACMTVFLVAIVALFWTRWKEQNAFHELSILLAIPIALSSAVFWLLLPTLNAEKSHRAMASIMLEASQSDPLLGVYTHSSLTGGVEYYSGKRTRALEGLEDLRAFRDSGGRIIVAPHWAETVLQNEVDFRVLSRLREGQRALVILEVNNIAETQSEGAPSP